MAGQYTNLNTNVFRRSTADFIPLDGPPMGVIRQESSAAASSASPGRERLRRTYDEDTLGLSQTAARLGANRFGIGRGLPADHAASDPGAQAMAQVRRGQSDADRSGQRAATPPRDEPRRDQRPQSPPGTRASPRSAMRPNVRTPPVADGRSSPSASAAGTQFAWDRRPAPSPERSRHHDAQRGVHDSSDNEQRVASPGSPQWARANTPPRRQPPGPVAAAPREHVPSQPDSFGRKPYVVPSGSGSRQPSGSSARAGARSQTPPSRRTAPVKGSGAAPAAKKLTPIPSDEHKPPPRRGITPAERERVKARNQTVPNRQPRTPRVRDSRIRGDFGLPEELPPTRPRVDSATYELREGLHKVTEEMRQLNERLLGLTSTHWELQQEAEELRREIAEAEAERAAVRTRFDDMCRTLKADVDALADEVGRKNQEVEAARLENERLKQGALVVSDGARERRYVVERAMRADPAYVQPPILSGPSANTGYGSQHASAVGGYGGNDASASHQASSPHSQRFGHSAGYVPIGAAAPVMQRMPENDTSDSNLSMRMQQQQQDQRSRQQSSRNYTVGGGASDGRWR